MAIKLAKTTAVLEITDVGNFDICIGDPKMWGDFSRMQEELASIDLQNIDADAYEELSEKARSLIASALIDENALETIFGKSHDLVNEVIVMTEIVRLFNTSESVSQMTEVIKEIDNVSDLMPE